MANLFLLIGFCFLQVFFMFALTELFNIYRNLYIQFTKKQDKQHFKTVILLTFLLFFIISLVFWRFSRRERIIYMDVLLTNIKKPFIWLVYHYYYYDFSILNIILFLISMLFVVIIFLFIIIILIKWVKAKIYVYHIYLFKYRFYSNLRTKLTMFRADRLLWTLKLFNNKYWNLKMPFVLFLYRITAESFYIPLILDCCIRLVPLYMVIYDVVIYWKIEKVFLILPWIFMFLLLKNLYMFLYVERREGHPKDNFTDAQRYLYIYEIHKNRTFVLNCKTLETSVLQVNN
jgi:hypothetical protein